MCCLYLHFGVWFSSKDELCYFVERGHFVLSKSDLNLIVDYLVTAYLFFFSFLYFVVRVRCRRK